MNYQNLNTINPDRPLRLSSPVTDIPRVGPVKAEYLSKLGITHARDFLFTFPRKHDDFSHITPINQLEAGAKMTIRAKVKTVKTDYGWQGRRRLLRIFVDLEDDTGVLNVTWYNLRFLERQLWQGRELLVAGTVEANPQYNKQIAVKLPKNKTKGHFITQYRMRSPVIEFVTSDDPTHTGRITPVYPETYGVTSRFLRYQVKNLLPLIKQIPEYLPPEIIQRHDFIGIHEAISQVHFPDSTQQLEQARRRLRFDELFFLQLAALVRRRERRQQKAVPIKPARANIATFIARLPFSLTGAQQRSVEEIFSDMKQPTPMNRLLQGDVGSGKSAVALIAAHAVLAAKQKVIYLAPTEILARQQHHNFSQYLTDTPVYLLVGATKQRDKASIKLSLTKRIPAIAIGTHALLQDDLNIKELGLVIIDEQHRFGVKQRKSLLRQKKSLMPHLLTMTATPIPRTLSLTVFGDLDLSVLDELPPGRQPITTTIITSNAKEKTITFILEQLHQGRQAYVIAPLVEQSDRLQVKSAQETVKEMRAYFPDIAIELIHGRLKPLEKQSIMNNYFAGAIQLLVSTAVVEVGVDVPNATCMIIEGAERFGLAQLHQFRGRIGRGTHQSFCYLFPSTDEAAANERLLTLAKTTDGFTIAEADLRLRGPGEAYGLSQSGFNDLQVASLLDYATINIARNEADKLLERDPHLLKYPILQKKVAQKNLVAHFE
ncbi:MAG: ATP-dependent DNA helicase RecG [Candidatus Andersenbacteria bacterium RIFCSPHIGHO2_12_FULL_46_9]|nr:MAG: ATP-dependent DNA helicase RecG [Parcubacteria group bacterium GW2011_GWA2_45_14]OGY33498.1 MAG: ATP-dependent DNA helicase RecG [Candidatus Andersenbacteria bacterium RIFCSPHIGHO2_02_FULL_46_16]OGY36355.1 MAG: ATP-dependent DNA helicase RecG [Candidatus Andersenbacteria bacterium RIFCSPLOWO2_02_FULL_46_11]OGY37782.1 MAG: ATP-dependent DNA helicase RecG [Candidatus Andersenbacteria bacterium RIFCSPHIGHO2_12_FULL_46_9]OGY42329.1 MAG: ATP-dependent DNA helicase RecG [Candidatus Andersenba